MNKLLVERVAKAMRDVDPLARGYRGDWPAYVTTAKAAIAATDAFRREENRKNCHHDRRVGNGSLSSDGASSYQWFCPECGASEKYETSAFSSQDGK